MGEIVSVTWENIDLDQRCIYLDGRVTKNGESRIVPIHAELLTVLKRRKKEGVALFTYRMETVSRRFGDLVERLSRKKPSLKELVFHGLRHTALTNLKRAGADILTLKAIGGHKTMAMLQRYVHVDYKDVEAIFKRM